MSGNTDSKCRSDIPAVSDNVYHRIYLFSFFIITYVFFLCCHHYGGNFYSLFPSKKTMHKQALLLHSLLLLLMFNGFQRHDFSQTILTLPRDTPAHIFHIGYIDWNLAPHRWKCQRGILFYIFRISHSSPYVLQDVPVRWN